MKRSLLLLVLGFVLVFSLAACSDSKDSEEPKLEDKSPEVEDLPEDTIEDELESDAGHSIEGDDTVGVTVEEFRQRFNESASSRGFEFEMEDYSWSDEYASGATLSTSYFAKGISLVTAIKDESSEALKAILLEVEGHESRELPLDIIEVLIESASPDLTADETKEIMQKLGLTDPDRAGNIKEFQYVYGGLKYLLNDEEGNWIMFGIANENDKDLGEN